MLQSILLQDKTRRGRDRWTVLKIEFGILVQHAKLQMHVDLIHFLEGRA